MQTTSSVETGINHNTFAVVVFTQNIRIYRTEAAVVHWFDMYIAQTAIWPFIHICRTLFYPTFIQQTAQRSTTDRLHHLIPAFFWLCIVEWNQYLLACLSVQQRREISIYRLTVNLFNHYTRFYPCRFPVERTFFHHFVHFHAFPGIIPIIKQSQAGSCFFCSRTITATCMRYVQFAQQFTQHFRIVILIIDMRQETTIISGHSLPIYPVHIHLIKTFLFLTAHIIIHIGTFGSQIHLHFCTIRNRFQLLTTQIHFLHGTWT